MLGASLDFCGQKEIFQNTFKNDFIDKKKT